MISKMPMCIAIVKILTYLYDSIFYLTDWFYSLLGQKQNKTG